MKNVLKRLMAVVLTVSTLTALLCISSNAIAVYSRMHSTSGGINILYAHLANNYGTGAAAQVNASVEIKTITICRFAVVGGGIYGHYNNSDAEYDSYTPKMNQYTNKQFTANKFTCATTLTTVQNNDTVPLNVAAEKCGIVYAGGKDSGTYSSTFCYRYIEPDPVTLLPITTYFSNIAGDCILKNWNGTD